MSVKDLEKYERRKKEIKDEVVDFLKDRSNQWVSDEDIREQLDIDFDYIDVDEALTGEYWSVRKRIENKSAKIKRDGYYEWVDFYKYKPFIKSKKFKVIVLLIAVVIIVIGFHFIHI